MKSLTRTDTLSDKKKQEEKLRKQAELEALIVKYTEKSGLDSEEIMQIKDAFDFIDRDGSGQVSKTEIEAAKKIMSLNKLAQIEFAREGEEIDESVEEVNIFDDLLAKMVEKKKTHVTVEDMIELFSDDKSKDKEYYNDVFLLFTGEKSSKKFLTLEDMRQIAAICNENISEKELKQMITRADTDKDGVVGKDEFVRFMLKTDLE